MAIDEQNKNTPTLNPKQRAFCIEYVKDHNATQAAIRAGYSAKAARGTSCRMLTNANIQQCIAELEKNSIPDAAELIRSNVKFWIDMRNSPEARDTDKIKASELLGRHLAMFVDKAELTGRDGAPLFPERVAIEIVRPADAG